MVAITLMRGEVALIVTGEFVPFFNEVIVNHFAVDEDGNAVELSFDEHIEAARLFMAGADETGR